MMETATEKQIEEDIQYKIRSGCQDGLMVVEIENKGRGVVTTKPFNHGDFLVQYSGDLISMKEGKKLSDKYSKDPTKGCYMYYFNYKNKNYCIDATAEDGTFGRLLNHSKKNANCYTKIITVKDIPCLIFLASRNIAKGEELVYDYGDRSKASVMSHPWLKF